MNSSSVLSILLLELFFSTLFVFNVKSLLLAFALAFVLIHVVIKKTFLETSLLVFFASLPFENAIRQWVFYSSEQINIGFYEYIFNFNLKIVLGAFVFLLLLPHAKTFKTIYQNKQIFFLSLFYTLAAITSLFFQTRDAYVFVGFIRLSLSLLFYFAAIYFFKNRKSKKIIISYFIALSVFCSYVGGLQLLRQNTLGKYIELIPSFAPNGYTTTDGAKQFRVSGFISHPVYFGSFMSMLIPIITAITYIAVVKKSKYRFLVIPLLITSIAVTLGTLSRTTWINLAVTFFLFYQLTRSHQPFNLGNLFRLISPKLRPYLLTLSLLVLIPLALLLTTRLESILDLFKPQGNLTIRLDLASTSLQLALQKPLTGIGLNNFPYEAKQLHNLGGFPPPPHNTILIFLTELGIPATVLFVFFLWFLLRPRTNPFTWPVLKFGLWLSLITFVISSQFHPLFNLDPTFDLFMFTAGIFTTLCQEKST